MRVPRFIEPSVADWIANARDDGESDVLLLGSWRQWMMPVAAVVPEKDGNLGMVRLSRQEVPDDPDVYDGLTTYSLTVTLMNARKAKPVLIGTAFGLAGIVLLKYGSGSAIPLSIRMTEAESVAVIEFNGKRIVQANGVRCGRASFNDGIVHVGEAPISEGDRHWLDLADGSIAVFPYYSMCATKGDALGTRYDTLTNPRRYNELSEIAFVFDSASKPTRVDILTSDAFTHKDANPRLRSVTLTREDRPITSGLERGFPGLIRLAVPEPGGTRGFGGDIRPGNFIGVEARVTRLASNTRCGTSAISGTVILSQQDKCGFSNKGCTDSAPTRICGTSLGGLRISLNRTFSKATVDLDHFDRYFLKTLYDARLPVFGNVPSKPWLDYRKWTPVICVSSTCAATDKGDGRVTFYQPATQLLIDVGPVHDAFNPKMFSGRGIN